MTFSPLRLMRLLLLLPVALFCAFGDETGTNGFDFLSIAPGARPVALGGAYSAEAGDLYSFAYNPAGLATLQRPSFIADYMHYVLDMNRGLCGAAIQRERLGGLCVAGLYVNYFSAGSFEAVNEQGERLPAEDFTAASTEIGLSVARDHLLPAGGGTLLSGITLKWVNERIGDSRNDAMATDVGLQWALPRSRLRLAAAVRNFGGYGGREVPQAYVLGINYATQAVQRSVFMLDFYQPVHGEYTARFGAEFWVNREVAIRGGYRILKSGLYHFLDWLNNEADEDYIREDFNTWSTGLGLKVAKRLLLDIAVQGTAFQNMPLIEATLLYSLSK
ncbi:MAG: hypothetical protein A2293_13985 [Elusimicrobia bacterium RIFOXYB2_FULL_49_7]|nr:MAG: hypothetical protein A2293_13985 [Elusimicrobia bacterium RIFOXYB2_FULL_49_7]